MGLFGGGALKRKVASLTDALESAQKQVNDLEQKCAKLESDLSSKDESFRVAKEGRQKAEKKLEKLAAKSMNSDRKMTELTSELERVKSDLSEYRDTVLSARAESDRLKAKLARHTESPKEVAPIPSSDTDSTPAKPVMDERRVDRKVARLQEQLESEREQKDEIKARALRAEQAIRDASKKRASDAGKLDAKLREAQHALQSERKAYKILQLQYEGLLEGKRGQRQIETVQSLPEVSAPTEAAPASPTEDVTNETAATEPNSDATEAVVEAGEPTIEDTKTEATASADDDAQQDAPATSAAPLSADDEEKAAESADN